ncbi:something about silencing protein 10 isoform X2 [Mangifera indica]|uniref:something about silencing protein 10 isoform X2 n=1 Tax=Mangifera indica TaxID=29780 RepID=UPI001CF93C9E|nr:something about silencing protein 10 isoform X2 [Mangifera indica]
MGKRGRSQKGSKSSKRRPRDEDVNPEDMDDEIDTFHKQRDVIPLDINGDVGDSDEDNEHPVFDVEGDDEDDVKDEDWEDEDDDEDARDTGMAAKIARQQKFLRAKFGGVEDEMHDDEDEGKEDKKTLWGGMKSQYYYGDNRDFELQSSDDDSPAEEEAEVIRMLKERAKSLKMEDFGLQDATESEDESDRELTLEEISVKGKRKTVSAANKEAVDDMGTAYEEVKKDLNALSREEQMDVVYSSAPELVGLLSELNDALAQLDNKVNPLLRKVKEQEIKLEGGVHYLEVKQLLLLAYCQAITFYLLLKSEGQPVRDHPVIARLVGIKGLLDKTKKLDANLPSEFDEILKKDHTRSETVEKLVKANAVMASDSVMKDQQKSSYITSERKQAPVTSYENELEKVESLRDHECKGGKHKRQSMEMLKVRAALEEKLKQKGVFSTIAPKPDKVKKRSKPVNGQLETYEDFNDDDMDVDGQSNGHVSSLHLNKLSQLVTAQPNKPKVVSGDDDLPKRDDIGERRRKHELKVLAGAGIRSEDDGGDEIGVYGAEEDGDSEGDEGVSEDQGTEGSEDEFYKQVKHHRAQKLAAKAEIYTRTQATPSLPETVDGKRQISYQMEKNRGLTRPRKKLLKNPRKKYRTKHQKAVMRRKGQVRDIRKPTGPYGGEASGINAGISRSTRFKN